MAKRRMFYGILMALIGLSALAGCGGGGGSSSTSSQLRSALSVVTTNLTFPSLPSPSPSLYPTGAIVRLEDTGWTWESCAVTNVSYSNVLANIVITDNTATASATFTVSGHQHSAGHCPGGGTWGTEGDFTLQGSGTVNFEKVDGVWRVADIPAGIVLKSNNTLAPSITAYAQSPNPAFIGSELAISATVSNASGATHGLYVAAARGFGYDSSAPIDYSLSNPYYFGRSGAVGTGATVGNNYGAIHVWQVVEVTPGSSWATYFSCYIDYAVVSGGDPL